jgi:UDP-glucuronate 4-epimerase
LQTVSLNDYIETIENKLGLKAKGELLPMQKGEMSGTSTNLRELAAALSYCPATPVSIGVWRFMRWYRDCYGV